MDRLQTYKHNLARHIKLILMEVWNRSRYRPHATLMTLKVTPKQMRDGDQAAVALHQEEEEFELPMFIATELSC